MVTAALAAGFITAVILFAGELVGPQPRSFRASIVSGGPQRSVGVEHTPLAARNVGLVPATARQGHRSRPVKRPVSTRMTSKASGATSASTEVVYHTATSQPVYSPASSSSHETAAVTSAPLAVNSSASSSGPSSAGSTGSTGATTTGASAASAAPPRRPAFGANGALGPMSSHDG